MLSSYFRLLKKLHVFYFGYAFKADFEKIAGDSIVAAARARRLNFNTQPQQQDVLAAGNLVTDGPELGIYIPGFGVVRTEDNVPVAKDGGEKLTVGSYSTQP